MVNGGKFTQLCPNKKWFGFNALRLLASQAKRLLDKANRGLDNLVRSSLKAKNEYTKTYFALRNGIITCERHYGVKR